MSVLYLAGPEFNMLKDVALTPSSEDSNFPAADYFADGDPGSRFKFSGVATNPNVIANLGSKLRNGDFEGDFISNIPQYWTDISSGDGAVAGEENSIVNAGGSTKSCKFTTGASGTGIAGISILMLVEAGWYMTASVALRRAAGNGLARARIINLTTGRSLTSGNVWSPTQGDWASHNADTWKVTTGTFRVEEASVSGKALNILLVRCGLTGVSGVGYADDFKIWPHWDFAALANSDYPSIMTARVRSDDNAAFSSATNRVLFQYGRPIAFGIPSFQVSEQFAQFYFEGTPPQAFGVGEAILGRRKELPNTILLPAPMTSAVTIFDLGSRSAPVSLEDEASKDFRIETFGKSEAEIERIRLEFSDAVKEGGGQLFIVPDDSKQEAYYGSVGRMTEDYVRPGLMRFSTEFRGFPFSVKVA